MRIPIVISGALGKMGSEIAALVLADPACELRGAIERPGHPRLGHDYAACTGRGTPGITVTDALDPGSIGDGVVIDFSSPAATTALLEKTRDAAMRLVIGTTGLSSKELSLAQKAAERMPVLVSPNMSLGVNLLFALTEFVAGRLKDDFDIEIIEAHHRFKKDAPSGTAKRLGEIVAQAYNLPYEKAVCDGRSGISATDRKKNEVGMHAVRGGDIVGDHTVLFAGMGERIELRHMMHSRSTLARGAVAAAKWLFTQKPGYYSMKDVLGL